MAKSKQNNVEERAPTSLKIRNAEPRSLGISERGIKTGAQFANLMSAMMSDIVSGRITPAVGNAACNAGGKLLKVVEMQHRYGSQNNGQVAKSLVLAPGIPEAEVVAS